MTPERTENMENNDDRVLKNLSDAAVEKVPGGSNINKVICCTCGGEIQLTGPMMSEYYNHNICPRCKGRLKSW